LHSPPKFSLPHHLLTAGLFQEFLFVCILHICVLWDQQDFHACLLRFAGTGGIVKILFLVQWQLTWGFHCYCIKTEFSRYLRHQRSVASRHGKRVDSKAHRYVEYKEKVQKNTGSRWQLQVTKAAFKGPHRFVFFTAESLPCSETQPSKWSL